MSDASLTRGAQSILKAVTARLAGRGQRGPDAGEGRRTPRRHSYDEADPRAKPWARIHDGSVAAGLAHREAMVATAEQLYIDHWRKFPLADVRQARAELDAADAELKDLMSRSPAEVPVGRPAALRQQIFVLKKQVAEADQRLRRTDITVLKALLQFLDFATGRLFPSIDRIAANAGCHRNSVIAALRRLKVHGFVEWVRRTTVTGNEGQFAPQREQTSNAYYFDNRRRMAKATWMRFTQILTAKLRRLGRRPAGVETAPTDASVPPPPPGTLGEAIASLGVAVFASAST